MNEEPIEFNNESGIATIELQRRVASGDNWDEPNIYITVKCGPIIQLRFEFGKKFASMLVDLLSDGTIRVPVKLSPSAFTNAKLFKKGGRCIIFDAETFGMIGNRATREE